MKIQTLSLLGALFLGIPPVLASRIITTSPALTELVYQLGHGDKIVGVSEFSDSPGAAKKLPRIGSLFYPSIERTLQLRPEWILVDSFTLNPSFLQALEALHLKFKTYRISSIEALFTASEEILKGVLHATSDSLQKYAVEIQSLRNQARPFRFLVLTWAEPAIAATRGTFLSNLFELIGGVNVVPAIIKAPYVPLSLEWLLQNGPDFVFVLHGGEPGVLEKVAEYFPLKATKVLSLSPDYFARSNFSGLEGVKKILGEMGK